MFSPDMTNSEQSSSQKRCPQVLIKPEAEAAACCGSKATTASRHMRQLSISLLLLEAGRLPRAVTFLRDELQFYDWALPHTELAFRQRPALAEASLPL